MTLVPIEQKTVAFYEDEIIAVRLEDGAVMVPLRPVCDALGVDWSAQRQRIGRDVVLSDAVQGVVVTTTPSPDGRGGGTQEMVCLPLDYLNGWLFGINANRVKDEIRDRLIRYQRECYRALADAFQRGELTTDSLDDLAMADPEAVQAYQIALAVVKLARSHIALSGRVDDHERRLGSIEAALARPDAAVTQEQAAQISQAVKAVAIAYGKQTKRNEFGAVYGELYRKFGITSYKLLPAGKFDEAMRFLTDWHQNLVGDGPF